MSVKLQIKNDFVVDGKPLHLMCLAFKLKMNQNNFGLIFSFSLFGTVG